MAVKTKNNIVITNHAFTRAKRRMNLHGNKLVGMAKKAIASGIGYNNCKDEKLRDYIKVLYNKEKRADNIRIYGYFVYVFKNRVLLTVYDLQDEYKYAWNDYSKKVSENDIKSEYQK